MPQDPAVRGLRSAMTENVVGRMPRPTEPYPSAEDMARIWFGSRTERPSGVYTPPGAPRKIPNLPPSLAALQDEFPYAFAGVKSYMTVPVGRGGLTAEGNEAQFDPVSGAIEGPRTMTRETAAHELTHAQQFQNFPDPAMADWAYFRDPRYWWRSGEQVARAAGRAAVGQSPSQSSYSDIYAAR